MPATAAPPTTAPTAQPTAPKPGPSVAAVNMPAPPSMDAKPADAPNKGATFDDMFDKYAKPPEEAVVPKNNTPKPAETPKPEDKVNEPKSDDKEIEDVDEPVNAPESKVDPKSGKTGDKKVSPWKLVEEGKKERLKLETEISELRKLVPNEVEAKASVERLTKAESRVKELEDHLRFIDYQNHPEFKEKYEKPYNDAWSRMMKRLSGVGVTNADGTKRAVEVKDILELGQLPADVVIEQAEAKFGKLGPWVAERIEDLKQLSEAKIEALDKAKKEGSEKIQKDAADSQLKQKEINEFLGSTWKKASEEIETHSKYGKYFKPVEGDDEFNKRLQSGTELVDKALSENPTDPNLTPQQRETIVKRHAAMRQRARAFGPMQLTIDRQAAEIERLTTELAQFKGSEPKVEGQRQDANGHTPPADPLQSIFANIEKYARPVI